ncbi:MAG: hypothetical protein OXD50_07635 [Chloroflexi bacterium]|nr:hypothetical protein [Chloroflexota bacterium]
MTVVVILASLGAIVVALITMWNTVPIGRQRLRFQRAIRARRVGKELAKRTDRFASEPVLVEFEDRFDELIEAYEAKQLPHDLRVLWAQLFRLADESPVGRPFRYGALEVHRDMNAMTVRKGSASITGRDWLQVYPIPVSPPSAVNPPSAPIPVIKD